MLRSARMEASSRSNVTATANTVDSRAVKLAVGRRCRAAVDAIPSKRRIDRPAAREGGTGRSGPGILRLLSNAQPGTPNDSFWLTVTPTTRRRQEARVRYWVQDKAQGKWVEDGGSNTALPLGRQCLLAYSVALSESDIEFLKRVIKDARGTAPTALEEKYFAEDKDSEEAREAPRHAAEGRGRRQEARRRLEEEDARRGGFGENPNIRVSSSPEAAVGAVHADRPEEPPSGSRPNRYGRVQVHDSGRTEVRRAVAIYRADAGDTGHPGKPGYAEDTADAGHAQDAGDPEGAGRPKPPAAVKPPAPAAPKADKFEKLVGELLAAKKSDAEWSKRSRWPSWVGCRPTRRRS